MERPGWGTGAAWRTGYVSKDHLSEATRQAGEGAKKGFLEGRAEVKTEAQPTVIWTSTHGVATA